MGGGPREAGRWFAVVLGVCFGVSLLAACDGSGDRSSARRSRSVADRNAATKVIERLRPNDATGFDPASWAAVADQAAVLPLGGKIIPDRKSWDIRGDVAAVDATFTVPGRVPQREWLFLHKASGAWQVYASLPLETTGTTRSTP